MEPVPGFMTLLVAAILFAVAVCGQSTLPQENLTITVTGSFRQNATGLPFCTECDCYSSTCTWVDNFNCTADRPTAGPDDNQERWGSCGGGCLCFSKSGVGFQGVKNIAMVTNPTDNEPTRIGKVTHYNNVIDSGSPTRLRLALYVDSPQLPQQFIIGYPLDFKETDNQGGGADDLPKCDPGIQRTTTPCDDIFVFPPVQIQSSFVVNGRQYTLEIVGFLQPQFGFNTPIRQFVTEETHATTADVYARIISFCAAVDCGPRGKPGPAPACGCVCSLTDDDCQLLFGANYTVTDDCSCACPYNNTVCPAGFVNPDNCGCACNITDADCFAINPLFQLNPNPDACDCVCNKDLVLQCSTKGNFWIPEGDQCACVCNISDKACVDQYGADYTANFDDCICEGNSGGGGLSGGAIAGIVIGSIAGAVLLVLAVVGLAALLVFLIRSGKIPGIYGYKLEAANMTGAQNSALFKDKWSVAGNQLS